MLANQLYTTQQIVWAKLQPYPWWPAKIVKTLQQSKQTLYKILFFADKTYSYLHSDHLQNFDTFNPPADQSFINPQTQKMLQTAIKLVQEHRNKSLKLKKMKKHDQIIENQQIQGQRLEKKSVVIMEEKNEYGNDKLCVQIEGPICVQRGTSTDFISTMNVIEMIEATLRPQKKLDYCYEKRKQQICHIKFLKQKLLLKYNLLQISKKTESKINKKSQSIVTHNQKRSQKIYKAKPINKSYVLNNYKAKKQSKHDIETLKHKSANKIKKMLSSSQDDPEYIRRESKDIMRRIIFLSDHSQIKFHSLILTLIKSIATSHSYAKCDEKLINFKHYLQRLEHEKQWDEQGSKLTQIEGMG